MATSAQQLRKRFDVAVLVAFLAAIYAPTFDLFVREDVERGPAPEFRNPAPKPGIPRTAKEFYKFPATYEAYFGDTFGLRDKLLRWNSYEKYFWLGTSPTKSQLVGHDGWFFYTGDNSMEILRGAYAFTEEELVAWQNHLEARAQAHAAAGRRFLFVLIPNKETVYPERLPGSVHADGPTRMDQLFAWMRAHSDVDVLDLRPFFREDRAADTGPMDALYSPYGTHWTSRGVYTAYRAIIGHLTAGTPKAGPLPMSEFQISRFDEGADTCAGNLYLQGILVQPGDALFPRTADPYVVLEQKDSPPRWMRTRGRGTNLLPHAIVFHDSFGPFIASTLALAFETLDMSEGRYNPARVDPQDTKIVVEMFVERYLRTYTPKPEDLQETSKELGSLDHTLFDLVASPERAQAVEGLSLVRTATGGFRLERKSAKDGLVLGPFRSPALGVVRMLLDFEAEEPGSLDVMWRRTDGETFTRTARTQLPIGPGRDRREIEVPALGAECEIMLRPTAMRPAITVYACTIKSAEAP